MVGIERVYHYQKRDRKENEYIVLVDRLWPRGICRSEIDMDEWLKEVSPSTELRKWFNHDPEKWLEFKQRYLEELQASSTSKAQLNRIHQLSQHHVVTLLYSARDELHNQAEALKYILLSCQWESEL